MLFFFQDNVCALPYPTLPLFPSSLEKPWEGVRACHAVLLGVQRGLGCLGRVQSSSSCQQGEPVPMGGNLMAIIS